MTYNRFVQGLKAAGVEVDRKILADLAVTDAGRVRRAGRGRPGGAAGRRRRRPRTTPERGRRALGLSAPARSACRSSVAACAPVRRCSPREAPRVRRRAGSPAGPAGPRPAGSWPRARRRCARRSRSPGCVARAVRHRGAADRHAELVDAAPRPGVPVAAVDRRRRWPALARDRHPAGPASRSARLARRPARGGAGRPTPRLVARARRRPRPGQRRHRAAHRRRRRRRRGRAHRRHVDPYNGKCVRASAGCLFHLPVVHGAPGAPTPSPRLRGAGCRCWPPTAPASATSTTLETGLGRPDRLAVRQRGLGAAARRSRALADAGSGSRSTAGPRA